MSLTIARPDAISYLLGKKEIKCKVLDDNHEWRFKGSKRKFKFIPWKVIAKNRMNEVFYYQDHELFLRIKMINK